MGKKWKILLALLLAVLLTACSGKEPEPGPGTEPVDQPQEPYSLTVRLSEAQTTLDPASVTARGGEAILFHLFENLMRWEDDGSGWAVIGYGQAENCTIDTDYAGNSTYTFTLREGIVWSDGTAVTAGDFAAAWQRLADPANDLPHRALLEAVSGYAEVQETGDTSLLGVSAPDDRTFVVSLNGSPSYFLEEVCASAYTMPACPGADSNATGAVTNGAYVATGLTGTLVTLERSETYYQAEDLQGPQRLDFAVMEGSEADYAAFQAGEAALVMDLPDEALQALADGGNWTPEPVSESYAVLLNTRQAPFDNPDVRLAFRLAAASQAVTERMARLTVRATPGIVPYGIADYSERPQAEEPEKPEEPVLPDPNAEPVVEEEVLPDFWDFRAHSLHLVTLGADQQDYASDCLYAKALMAQAGYANGSGFPAVEYIYVDSGEAAAAAQALQAIWKEQLGVTVTLRAVSQEEYGQRIAQISLEEEATEGEEGAEAAEVDDGAFSRQIDGLPAATGNFTMAAQPFTAPYSDAGALLEFWYSKDPANVTGYSSAAFDILLNSARAAVSPDARDAYLHDAEAILLTDAAVIPVFCRGGSYLLREDLTGLYRSPNGVYFLQNTVQEKNPS
ncbi:MAG: peptide ABC transporter substrate-binding protein [Oscillospiraceae bacterium]|nr:peptide ABC transporter substrate-binding protein [Oscillospiraceae bacterium]